MMLLAIDGKRQLFIVFRKNHIDRKHIISFGQYITLTAGLLEKFSPVFAAKFSFLLSIPTIALAGGYEGLKLVMHGSDEPWDLLAIGFVTAFVTGLIFIKVFMNIIEKIGVMPFVIYRMLLSAFLFLMIFAF